MQIWGGDVENRVVFISDIHANAEAFKAVLQDIEDRKIPLSNVYCLGDSVGYGTKDNEVLDLLQEKRIVSVMGNHDEGHAFHMKNDGISDNNRDFLKNLERSITLSLFHKTILLTHGSPKSISDYIFEEDSEKQEEIADTIAEDIIVFGHTHKSYRKIVKGKLFINVGSVGKPKDGNPKPCYTIVTFADDVLVEFVRV